MLLTLLTTGLPFGSSVQLYLFIISISICTKTVVVHTSLSGNLFGPAIFSSPFGSACPEEENYIITKLPHNCNYHSALLHISIYQYCNVALFIFGWLMNTASLLGWDAGEAMRGGMAWVWAFPLSCLNQSQESLSTGWITNEAKCNHGNVECKMSWISGFPRAAS